MTVNELYTIEVELKRFIEKLVKAKNRLQLEGYKGNDSCFSGYKETGAVRRAAMDLKRELTKIT